MVDILTDVSKQIMDTAFIADPKERSKSISKIMAFIDEKDSGELTEVEQLTSEILKDLLLEIDPNQVITKTAVDDEEEEEIDFMQQLDELNFLDELDKL